MDNTINRPQRPFKFADAVGEQVGHVYDKAIVVTVEVVDNVLCPTFPLQLANVQDLKIPPAVEVADLVRVRHSRCRWNGSLCWIFARSEAGECSSNKK